MSLIQQALDRKLTPEASRVAEKSSGIFAPAQPAPAPQDRIKEKEDLKALEKKIEAIEKKAGRRSKASWILGGIILLALAGGFYWVYQFVVRPDAATQTPSVAAEEKPSVFRPLPVRRAAVSTKNNLSLTGITDSGGVRYALINNQVVTIGDMLRKENAVVKEILPKSVVLEQKGRPVTLELD